MVVGSGFGCALALALGKKDCGETTSTIMNTGDAMQLEMETDIPTIQNQYSTSNGPMKKSFVTNRDVVVENDIMDQEVMEFDEEQKVVDTIEDLQQYLRENRHSNLLALPTTTINNGVRLPSTATTNVATRLPLRQFITPAIYCSMVADALQCNTVLTSLTLDDIPLVNPFGGRRNGLGGPNTNNNNNDRPAPPFFFQPQPQLFWLGQSIASHPHLKHLALVDNRLGDAGVCALMQGWSLFQDSIISSTTQSSTESTLRNSPCHGFQAMSLPLASMTTPIRHSSCLQSLSLCSNEIGDQGAFWIVQAFLKEPASLCPPLVELDLSSNLITQEGAVSLAKLVAKSKRLTTLLLSFNAIGSQGAESLALALQANSQMTILGLSSNGIRDQGASALAMTARQHPTLQALLLEDNHIGSQGCADIVHAYQCNPRLGMMELSGNQPLSLSILSDIALALPTMQYLYLDSCGLHDAHITQFLAQAIRTNNTVQELFLEGNQIGSAGAIALAWALESNTTLEGLFLEGNPIKIAGARALCEILKTHNMTLRRLPIGAPCVDKPKHEGLLDMNSREQWPNRNDDDEDSIHLQDTIRQEMQVYLDMNASGRRRVLQSGVPPALWSHFLQREEVLFDPSLIFLFHKENPQLFQQHDEHRQQHKDTSVMTK